MFVVLIVALGGTVRGGPLGEAVRAEIEGMALCSTVDFEELKVNSVDGITEVEAEEAYRVRAGDRLRLQDIDVDTNEAGTEIEFEFRSEHTGDEDAEVEMYLYQRLRVQRGKLVDKQELVKAIRFFARPCDE
jgi:hypothetical protein